MGRSIDRLFLGLVTFGGIFVFLRSAFSSPTLAAALALVCFALVCYLARGVRSRHPQSPWQRRRLRRTQADALLAYWSRLPEAQALAEIRAALAALYPQSPIAPEEIALALRPENGPPLDINAIFALWREKLGQSRLLVVCTGRIEASAHAWARSLSEPRLCLLDREQLRTALAARPDLLPEPSAKARRPRRPRLSRIPRARALRCLPTALGLILGYLFLGRPLYLLAGLALLLAAGLSLRRRPVPAILFE